MGIRYLNKYIVEHCEESIKPINMENYMEKQLLIDISIYLYKYLMGNSLVNMYIMLSLFDCYNILKSSFSMENLLKKKSYKSKIPDKIRAKSSVKII